MPTRRQFLAAVGGSATAIGAGSRYAGRTPPSVRSAATLNVPLITQDGHRVRFYDDLIRGRVVLMNFMYADCLGVCPATTGNLREVQRLLGERAGRDVFMYSFTLRPDIDGPDKLRAYRAMHDVGAGWTFLTGRAGDIEQVRVRMGFADVDAAVDRRIDEHTGMVLAGNDRLNRWAMCPALVKPRAIHQLLCDVEGSSPPPAPA